jgi:hypothetical protein
MKQSKQSSLARKSPVLASLALACAMFAGNAQAGIPVVDGGHISAQLAKFVQDFGKWAKDFAHYKSQVDHMTQQLTDISKMVDSATLGVTGNDILANISERQITLGAERCDQDTGGGGFSPTQMLSGLIGGSSGGYVQKQLDICRQIVYLQNHKYNEGVRTLKKLKEIKTKGIDKALANAKSSSKNGQMDTTQTSAVLIVAEVEFLHAHLVTVNQVYDGMIAKLEQDMKTEAKAGLNGKKQNLLESMLSAAVSTGTMAVALNAQKSTCPSGFDCN